MKLGFTLLCLGSFLGMVRSCQADAPEDMILNVRVEFSSTNAVVQSFSGIAFDTAEPFGFAPISEGDAVIKTSSSVEKSGRVSGKVLHRTGEKKGVPILLPKSFEGFVWIDGYSLARLGDYSEIATSAEGLEVIQRIGSAFLCTGALPFEIHSTCAKPRGPEKTCVIRFLPTTLKAPCVTVDSDLIRELTMTGAPLVQRTRTLDIQHISPAQMSLLRNSVPTYSCVAWYSFSGGPVGGDEFDTYISFTKEVGKVELEKLCQYIDVSGEFPDAVAKARDKLMMNDKIIVLKRIESD